MMLTLAIILISVGILIHISTFAVSAYVVVKNYRQLAEQWDNFFAQNSADEPSNFSKIICQIADVCAERTRVAVMAAFQGSQGAAVRDATRGLEQVAAEGDPRLAVAAALPRGLKKNPLALAGLNMLVQNMLAKGNLHGNIPGEIPSNGSKSSQVKFNL